LWVENTGLVKKGGSCARHAKKWFQIVSQNLIYKKHLIKFPEYTMMDKGQKGTYVIRGGAVTLAMPGDCQLAHTEKNESC
jgi:hypothetical protein